MSRAGSAARANRMLDVVDRVHPNSDGDRRMAEQWIAGLRAAGLIDG